MLTTDNHKGSQQAMLKPTRLIAKNETRNCYRIHIRGGKRGSNDYVAVDIPAKSSQEAEELAKLLNWYLAHDNKDGLDLTKGPNYLDVFSDYSSWETIWDDNYQIESYSIYWYNNYGDRYATVWAPEEPFSDGGDEQVVSVAAAANTKEQAPSTPT